MQITYSMLTSRGTRRNNEDSVGKYEFNSEYCFVVADGLGGHERGEVASRLVTNTTGELFKKEGYREGFLQESFELSQERLMQKQAEEDAYDEMKTTLTTLVVGSDSVGWGHVGDSRLYRFAGEELVHQTKDHSVPQMLVRIGEIEEKDIRNHPDRSKLLNVMGVDWDKPKYDIKEQIAVAPGDSYLICTDGFWELIDEQQMIQCLKEANDVDEWIDFMEEVVMSNGSDRDMDNYSAIAVWIRESE